jgi:hypothetical protein
MSEVRIMKNGKRSNRTVVKNDDKKLAKKLYDEHEKADPRKVYEFVFKIKSEASSHQNQQVMVCYSPMNIVDKDEFDLKINFMLVEGQPFKFNVAERVEAHSAALNHYFINHAT